MSHPFKVGITGGIGSGKTLICQVLETMGYPVYFSDERAKTLMETDPTIRAELIRAFGEEAFTGNELNRPFLAKKVFQDSDRRETINHIVHPVVRADFNDWCAKQKEPVVFQESALLFETGGYQLLDFTVLVTAPVEERVRRVQLRDQTDETAVLARITSQLSDEAKIPLADFVIENTDRTMLLPQILELLAELELKMK